MTTVEVLFRYAQHPTETAMIALGNLHEVYGIRRIVVDAAGQTIRVEYDATRLTEPVVQQLLRRTGIDIVEEVALIAPPPPPAPEAIAAPPAAK